jgi:hypothetical protein
MCNSEFSVLSLRSMAALELRSLRQSWNAGRIALDASAFAILGERICSSD